VIFQNLYNIWQNILQKVPKLEDHGYGGKTKRKLKCKRKTKRA
jgi:hypothetical protein